jgi:hypothetical protein
VHTCLWLPRLQDQFHFTDGFTLGMISQSIAYLLRGGEHIYRTFDLQGEMHSIWKLWTSCLQECKGNLFVSNRAGQTIVFGHEVQKLFWWGCWIVGLGLDTNFAPMHFLHGHA